MRLLPCLSAPRAALALLASLAVAGCGGGHTVGDAPPADGPLTGAATVTAGTLLCRAGGCTLKAEDGAETHFSDLGFEVDAALGDGVGSGP